MTGGSRGLGLSISCAFAERGATVIIASRDGGRCAEAAGEIARQTGGECVGMAAHVGHWAECDDLVDRCYERFGAVDVLVNNAGMSPLYPSLLDVTEEMMARVLAVNFVGPFRLAVLVGSRMAKDGGGSIINVSSIGSVRARPTQLPYAGAKAALNAMTVGLAQEFGPRVRVNALVPGPFLTDVSKHWDMAAFDAETAPQIPLRRAGEPDEIVGAAVYLASDASAYTTGAAIKVDGGSIYTLS